MIAELYAQLKTVAGVDDVFDTKTPDEYKLIGAIIVVSAISDVPETAIDSTIRAREQRITCEVQALNLTTARAVKESLIAALNGWRGGPVGSCLFEHGGPELYDADLIPPRYCLPVDFMVTI
jgi:hypothetical protein